MQVEYFELEESPKKNRLKDILGLGCKNFKNFEKISDKNFWKIFD